MKETSATGVVTTKFKTQTPCFMFPDLYTRRHLWWAWCWHIAQLCWLRTRCELIYIQITTGWYIRRKLAIEKRCDTEYINAVIIIGHHWPPDNSYQQSYPWYFTTKNASINIKNLVSHPFHDISIIWQICDQIAHVNNIVSTKCEMPNTTINWSVLSET